MFNIINLETKGLLYRYNLHPKDGDITMYSNSEREPIFFNLKDARKVIKMCVRSNKIYKYKILKAKGIND